MKESFIEFANKRYFTNEEGEIFSMSNTQKFRKLTPQIRKSDGYQVFNVFDNRFEAPTRRLRSILVHRIVAAAWLNNGVMPNSKIYVIMHKDGNNLNNRPDNLEIVSRQDKQLGERKGISGVPYVRQIKNGLWTACPNGKYFSTHKTIEEAAKVVREITKTMKR